MSENASSQPAMKGLFGKTQTAVIFYIRVQIQRLFPERAFIYLPFFLAISRQNNRSLYYSRANPPHPNIKGAARKRLIWQVLPFFMNNAAEVDKLLKNTIYFDIYCKLDICYLAIFVYILPQIALEEFHGVHRD